MKRILVPTDFSSNAYSALFYATRLFEGQECEFFILHTFLVNTPMLTSRIDTTKGDLLYQKLSSQSKLGLNETLHCIVRDTEDLPRTFRFETLSVSKDLTITIEKTIKKQQIDLVVMGTKGATGTSGFIMGSNTLKIVKKIKTCPVLMVPDEFDFEKPVEIAFASDFRRFYLEKELKPLLDIALLFRSNIKIFHINDEKIMDDLQDYNYNALKKYLSGLQYSIHWISKVDQKYKLINNFIDQYNINILVMVNYKHSVLEGLTKEPVIKKIGFNPSIPFLVIPDAS